MSIRVSNDFFQSSPASDVLTDSTLTTYDVLIDVILDSGIYDDVIFMNSIMLSHFYDNYDRGS